MPVQFLHQVKALYLMRQAHSQDSEKHKALQLYDNPDAAYMSHKILVHLHYCERRRNFVDSLVPTSTYTANCCRRMRHGNRFKDGGELRKERTAGGREGGVSNDQVQKGKEA